MVIDELWPYGPKMLRCEDVFSLGTDSCLLASFAGTVPGVKKICDLGCGGGIISLLLLWQNPNASATGIEIQPHAVDIATENAAINGLENRFNAICGDLKEHRSLCVAGGFDLVVSNPPYFPAGSGKTAENEYIAIAREERACTLSDICKAASYLTRWGGHFVIVHRPERLSELCCLLSGNGLEPKRLRFIQARADSLPSLILIDSRRGGKPGLTIEPPLIMQKSDGSDSEEIKSIYHRS